MFSPSCVSILWFFGNTTALRFWGTVFEVTLVTNLFVSDKCSDHFSRGKGFSGTYGYHFYVNWLLKVQLSELSVGLTLQAYAELKKGRHPIADVLSFHVLESQCVSKC